MALEIRQNVHDLLYEYLVTLKIDAEQYQQHSSAPLSADIFRLPNKGAFCYVTYFLFDKFDHAQCKKKFEFVWPLVNKRNDSDFLKVAFNWLSDIANKNPDARMPKFTKSSLNTSSGDKLCLLYLAFAMFILRKSTKRKRNVKYLCYPSLLSKTKSAAFSVHSAMCENLLQQNDDLERHTKEVHQAFTDCASVLTCRNRELKCKIKTHKSSLAELNTEICEKFGKEVLDDAEKQMDNENNDLLRSVRTSWQTMEEHYNAFLPLKKVLLNLTSSDEILIDGNNYPINPSPSLISAIRDQLEKGNLLNVQEGGRLDWEKLVKFFSITLSTFDKPLKEMEAVLNVNDVLPHKELLREEVEKTLRTVDEMETTLIPSFEKIISEQERYLSTFNIKPKPLFIDGRNYFLEQATPELKQSLAMHGKLNDSTWSAIMNVSSENLFESPDSDNPFSPDLRRRVGATSNIPSNIPIRLAQPLKMNLQKSNLVVSTKLSTSDVTMNEEFNYVSNIKKVTDAAELLPQQTATKRRHSSHTFTNTMQGGKQIEDLFFGTLSNTSFSSSIMSPNTSNFSFLENQTLPDCPEFDLTSELDASNLLLELDV